MKFVTTVFKAWIVIFQNFFMIEKDFSNNSLFNFLKLENFEQMSFH